MQPPIDEDTRFRAVALEDDEAAEIRYSLTALGEAAASERIRRVRFRGFGPCPKPPESLLTLSDRL